MSRLVKVYISNTNSFFAKGLRLTLKRHLNQLGITVLFLKNVKLLCFADLLFLSQETLSACTPSDLHHLRESLTKSVLVTPHRNLITTPYSIKWVLHRHHTERDILALADHILHIRESDVEKHALCVSAHSPLTLLTGRQKQVIKLVAQGMSHRRISRIMSIDEKTVSSHKRSIMKKFNLDRTTDLHFWLTSHLLMSVPEK